MQRNDQPTPSATPVTEDANATVEQLHQYANDDLTIQHGHPDESQRDDARLIR